MIHSRCRPSIYLFERVREFKSSPKRRVHHSFRLEERSSAFAGFNWIAGLDDRRLTTKYMRHGLIICGTWQMVNRNFVNLESRTKWRESRAGIYKRCGPSVNIFEQVREFNSSPKRRVHHSFRLEERSAAIAGFNWIVGLDDRRPTTRYMRHGLIICGTWEMVNRNFVNLEAMA